jgi:predicted Zn-dependent protease
MIGSIDDGILVRTNLSWSIDDSRDKFQFGCEWGRTDPAWATGWSGA